MGTMTLKKILDAKTLWLAILVPLAVLPLPLLYPNKVAKCGYCVIVIGIYWVTEIIPLAATSLLPILLFPLFGIMSAKETCSSYAKDTLMLFLGSLIVAVAVERWNLHKRLALRTLTLVGPEPKWLMLGIMLPCWFLSMWMSNTATAAMMVPIVSAILEQIRLSQLPDTVEDGIMMESPPDQDVAMLQLPPGEETKENGDLQKEMKNNEDFMRLAKTFSLCTAFAANIGGMATLTGTPPNIIFKGQADVLFRKRGGNSGINFANWMVIGLPISIMCFLFTWWFLYVYTVRTKCFRCCKKGSDNSYEAVRKVLAAEYRKLGPMTFPEIIVLINFIILAILWITRQPGFIPGWADLFTKEYTGDSTCAILIAVLLFILPARRPCRTMPSRTGKVDDFDHYQPILNWSVVNSKVSWGVLLLMGGGFAMADACQRSGLSGWVSDQLLSLRSLPVWLVSALLSIVVAAATEVTSNAATTTLFVPIVGDLAIRLSVNPLYFMIPCTIAASLAFLLPVATPPNAIAFASGYLTVKDMVIAGFPCNVFALLVLNLSINAWVVPFFNLDTVPEIFQPNVTTPMPPYVSPVHVLTVNMTDLP